MIGRRSGELLLNFHAKSATQVVWRWSFEVAKLAATAQTESRVIGCVLGAAVEGSP